MKMVARRERTKMRIRKGMKGIERVEKLKG